LAWARDRLADGESAQLDATILLEYALDLPREQLIVQRDRELTQDALQRFSVLLEERASGVPIAYLVGRAGFYGREFRVMREVLVPRPETEHVVEAAIAELRSRKPHARRVGDVGTGSGAIAVTIAAEVADAVVWAGDLSEAALCIARANARDHRVEDRVRFVLGDLAAPFAAAVPFDVIVANLPYVPTRDVPKRPDPVGYEPALAIDGGKDGLVLYRRMLAQLPAILAPGAALFLEAAPPTIEALAALVETSFPGVHLEVGEDYSGCDRYVSAALP